MSNLGQRSDLEEAARGQLGALFEAALGAVDPTRCVGPHLPIVMPRGRIVVAGAGKAAAAMAHGVEVEARATGWFERLEGMVITRYGHGVTCERITVAEAAHPVPDEAGLAATERIRRMVEPLGENDLLIYLASGGGSALLTAPADGVSALEKAEINRLLLHCGASIEEVNCVRKHISAIKGGRLAKIAAPARILNLMISDVPGDNPSAISSGPMVPDPTTSQHAFEILLRYGIDVTDSVRRLLRDAYAETPKPGDPLFENVENAIIARPADMLAAAEVAARRVGLEVVSLGADLEGEARELGAQHADLARQIRRAQGRDGSLVILSGGETTVTVTGDGRGGRNAEYALGLAAALEGEYGIYAIACDTDGIDGVESNAGVIVTPDTLRRAQAAGFSAADTLERNDAYSLFAGICDLVVTGPTRTNVNDFRAILVT